jgi:tetratricopeptide (TPR) repeat protein
MLEQHDLAIGECRRALNLFTEVGNLSAQGDTWGSLGHAHAGLGKYDDAAVAYEYSAQLARELRQPLREADALVQLADMQQAGGNLQRARELRIRVLNILQEVDTPAAERMRTDLASKVAG